MSEDPRLNAARYRVARAAAEDAPAETAEKGRRDGRERHLFLTPKGEAMEKQLSDAQRARMRAAYRAAGPAAVQGFRQVLEAMMDPQLRDYYNRLRDGG